MSSLSLHTIILSSHPTSTHLHIGFAAGVGGPDEAEAGGVGHLTAAALLSRVGVGVGVVGVVVVGVGSRWVLTFDLHPGGGQQGHVAARECLRGLWGT